MPDPRTARHLFSWESALILALLGAWSVTLLLIERDHAGERRSLLEELRRESTLESHNQARAIERALTEVYQGMRTLARLPSIRNIDPDASSLSFDARTSAQEIYNTLASNVAVSEVYIIPRDFDPDAVEPGRPTLPIVTFDERIVGRTADDAAGPSDTPSGSAGGIPEIEIHEFRVMRDQIARLIAAGFGRSDGLALDYPALISREVITCDNTHYSPTNPNDRDRMGVVYSLPFYGDDGELKGIVSAVMLGSAISNLMSGQELALVNTSTGDVFGSLGRDIPARRRQLVLAGLPDPELAFSEIVGLNLRDLDGRWHLWAGAVTWPTAARSALSSARQNAWIKHAGVTAFFLLLAVIVHVVLNRQRLTAERNRRLEAEVLHRTRDLEAARMDAEAASRAKSAFLANISHEIRTPLNGIVGVVEMLQRAAAAPGLSRHLTTLRGLSGTLLDLLTDVLDLSRIEAGKLTLVAGPVGPANLVREVVALLAPSARTKGLALTAEMDTELPDRIACDGARLRQILVNLVSNAIKFTDRGSITVMMRAHQKPSPDNPVLEIDVVDTGCGIPAEEAAVILEPFGRARSSESAAIPGSGLGLSIVRGIVEAMSGQLTLESTVGQGTRFNVVIPYEPVVADVTREAAGVVLARGLKVLLVEDNAVNQAVGTFMLEELGCEVTLAACGQDAVALVENAHFDLALMDCRLPDISGLEATRIIRAREAEAGRRRLAIIAMTASALTEDRARCLEAGMDGYIAKPYTKDMVAAAIDASLQA